MNSENSLPPIPDRNRLQVAKDVFVFQLKLLMDGAKDLFLFPVSMIAGLVSIFLNEQPGDMFYRVLQSGKNMERWIDLFSAVEIPAQSTQEQEASLSEPMTEDQTDESKSIEQESMGRDFDSLLRSLQESVLKPESRARISEQSLEQLNALADKLRGKR